MFKQKRISTNTIKSKRRSYRGQVLSQADFSHCDIRGFDFTDAILNNAQFNHVKAGQPLIWYITTIVSTTLLTLVSGYVSAYSAGVVGSLMVLTDNQPIALYSSILTLLILGILILITLRRGLGTSLGAFSLIVAFSIVTLAGLGKANATVAAIVQAVAIGGAMSSSIFAAISLSTLKILASKVHFLTFTIIFLIGSFSGGWEGLERGSTHLIHGLPITIIITIVLYFFSVYMGVGSAYRENRYLIIHKTASFLSALGGTRFQRAHLVDANFTQACLRSVDFRNAILTRTNFLHARYLKQSYLKGTYLDNPQICELVVSQESKSKSFNDIDLRGINLEGRNLNNTTFSGANLSEATLRNANLAGASLVGTQLYKTDLCGASLTGAYIENWGISTDTNLDSIQCDYIYMRLPTEDDPDPCRKPDNRNDIFKDGDFSDFIAPIIKTLDLYNQQNVDPRRIAHAFKTLDLFHHEGLDPSAAAIALKQLAEQYPEARLEVVALEGRGDEKIRFQTRVTDQTNRSQLSSEYFEKYQQAADLPYGDLRALLATITEKDQRIQSLENMVSTAINSDKFYVETYYNLNKAKIKNPSVKKILILTANPQNTNRIRLDAEVREIQAGLERAKKRDQFEMISKWAVRPEDLRRALLDYEPQIVQFSGVGVPNEGLALENEAGKIHLVSAVTLASLFELFKDKVECVFLNACYSAEQAKAIGEHIPYVIGMNQEIGDRAALEFSVGFYDALWAGRSIEDAFKLGCISLDLEGLPESLTPVLKRRSYQEAGDGSKNADFG